MKCTYLIDFRVQLLFTTGWCPYCSEPVLLDIAEEHMQEKHPELCGGDREREEGEVTPRSGEADEDEVAFTLDCVDARSVVKVLRGHTGHFVTFVHF